MPLDNSNDSVDDFPEAWPDSVKEMRTLESSLRCPICGEFIDGCLSLPECQHSFCALCIQRSLGFREQCPVCRITAHTSDLQGNKVMDALVENLKACRSRLLGAVRAFDRPAEPRPPQPLSVVDVSHAPDAGGTGRLPSMTTPTDRRRTSSGRSTKPIEVDAGETSDSDFDHGGGAGDDDFDPEYVPLSQSHRSVKAVRKVARLSGDPPDDSRAKRAKRDQSASGFKTLDESPTSGSPREVVDDGTLETEPPHGKVFCPVCKIPILEHLIANHVDTCLTRNSCATTGSGPASNSRAFGSRPSTTSTAGRSQPKLMPKLVYNLMSDKQLKKRLTDEKLSTKGDRKTLERRHHEYTLRMNSALRSNKKQDANAIAAEVQKMERQRVKAESSTVNTIAATTPGQRTVANDATFAQLIQQVRSRQAVKKKEENEQSITHNTLETSVSPHPAPHAADEGAPPLAPPLLGEVGPALS
uniref:RING-type E3 ubiquitin transferase n=1 Tax=Pyramimonas obovata TaxID=1411642 RepID=A0A7S0WW35_9CHLO|mmetsp:Transcript_7099/g.14349  ORF Transcript_7099/g.14349 Transcript_7099/m.14349 type:complete len:471 (+) Transcript_7099:378-1790(+)